MSDTKDVKTDIRCVMLHYNGDTWFTLRQVFYNYDGQPAGHTEGTWGASTLEGIKDQVQQVYDAVHNQPILTNEDFVGWLHSDGDMPWQR